MFGILAIAGSLLGQQGAQAQQAPQAASPLQTLIGAVTDPVGTFTSAIKNVGISF